MAMKDEIKKNHPKLPTDNEMVVFEGCENDDQVLLGGKNAFLSHFCEFFKFNICHGPGDRKGLKKSIERFNDPEKLDNLLKSFDDKRYD